MSPQIPIDTRRIAACCAKWKIKELALFGSVLREDFRPDSDVDVLVTFAPDAPWDYFDWADIIDDLKEILGRQIDLVEEDTLKNPYRRQAILASKQVIYAA